VTLDEAKASLALLFTCSIDVGTVGNDTVRIWVEDVAAAQIVTHQKRSVADESAREVACVEVFLKGGAKLTIEDAIWRTQ
jgi:hypothetical protein